MSKFQKHLKKFFLKAGPSLILVAGILGPGSLAVASKAGATMGYSVLWVVVIACVMMALYARMGRIIGTLSDDTIMEIARKKYGGKATGIILGIAGFVILMGFQTGNNLGIGIAMSAIFGGSIGLWAVIFTSVVLILIWWKKDVYNIVEKVMTGLVLLMIISFFANLFVIDIDVKELAKGFIPSKPAIFLLVVAMSATTFSVISAIIQTYLVKDKKWTKETLKDNLKGSTTGVYILAAITGVIIVTSAAVLKPQGIVPTSAVEMGLQLEPLLGATSKWLFLFGLFSASFSSYVVSAFSGGLLLADGFKLGKSYNNKYVKIFASALMVISTINVLVINENPIELLVIAQASTAVIVPIFALLIIVLANNKKLMGEYRINRVENVIGIAAIFWVFYLSYNQIMSFIG